MGSSKDLFLKMTEHEYFEIPEVIRESFLRSKIYSESTQDFDELMTNKEYRDAYQMSREAKRNLEEITFMIRERKRKNQAK